MAVEHILVVEDDSSISRLISYNLNQAGYQSTTVKTGEEALEILGQQDVDLVLLDIMLPSIDGWEVCRRMRQFDRWKLIPIILVTAKGEETDRVVGFELGANDYVVKPFSVRELILRVKARLARQSSPVDKPLEILQAGDVTVDMSRRKVMAGNTPVILTNMEIKLLTNLMRKQGIVLSRKALLEDVWDFRNDMTTRTVDTHVKRLREKLKMSGRYIETIRGVGYRFKEESVQRSKKKALSSSSG